MKGRQMTLRGAVFVHTTSLPFQHHHSSSWKILLSTMFPHDAEVEKLENKLELIVTVGQTFIISVPQFHIYIIKVSPTTQDS